MRQEPVSTKNVLLLADEIEIPKEILTRIEESLNSFKDKRWLQKICSSLINSDTAAQTWKLLKKRFADDDENGLKILSVYLSAACLTRLNYETQNISDKIFLGTMKYFSRMLNEEHQNTGTYAFTHAHWGWRQLCCHLFRIGTLEFEYRLTDITDCLPQNLEIGKPAIFVHVPSTATLQSPCLNQTYKEALEFFTQHEEQLCEYGFPTAMICESWILSPQVRGLISHSSGLYQFSNQYNVYACELDENSVYHWVFNDKTKLEELPQNSSLQKELKNFIAEGGKIGMGFGIKH